MRRALVGVGGGRRRVAGVRLGPGLRRRRGPGTGELLLTDPFGTASLRDAVLSSWASSPTRFREDTNAEEDLRVGGYAETWCAELLQNAADAARSAGVPGRVRIRLVGTELRVANTGAPLHAAGVAALASLRASSKRDEPGATGRFGVGFAAVLALSTAPCVVSTTGGVAFSATRTAADVDRLPGPAAERARDGRVPVLRLVWPLDVADDDPVPDGYATEVRLPLTGPADGLLDRARADVVDLLLALPGLDTVEIDGAEIARSGKADGTVRIGPHRWRTVTTPVPDGGATLTWAAPLDGTAGDVLHAPTATAEQLSFPARLIAPFPLDPDRRRIRSGPRADALVDLAARTYADLVRAAPPDERAALVPAPGFPRSPLDGRLRDAVAEALAAAPWLPGAAGTDLAPHRAEWLDLPADGLPELLAETDEPAFERLTASGTVPPAGLDVARVAPSDLVDRLLGVTAGPEWWHRLYDVLDAPARTVPGLVDDLRALPVPLADGRLVRGPGSVLLPEDTPDPAVTAVAELGLSGLHVAARAAVHPLLRRLGAGEADRAALRSDPALLDAVDRSLDDADDGLDVAPLARAVLALLGPEPAKRFGALALPDTDGVPTRADELVLPDAAIRPLLHPDAPVGVLDTRRLDAPRAALVAAGVLDGFATTTDPDRLADADAYSDEHPDTPPSGVRDLDLVADDAWPDALRLLAGDRDTRAALLEPDGYTAWWLSRHALLGGHAPGHWRLPSATAAGLLDPAPVTGVDDAVLAAVGVRAAVHVGDADDAADLVARLADPHRTVAPDTVTAAHRALTDAVDAGRVGIDDVGPPDRVRTATGACVDAAGAVVLDVPWALPVLDDRAVVVGGDPARLADLLDLPLASDTVAGTPVGAGTPRRWSEVAEVVVACHTLGVPVPDGELVVHERLEVDLTAPRTARVTVPTWAGADGRLHASDPLRALLAAVAGPVALDAEPAAPVADVLGS